MAEIIVCKYENLLTFSKYKSESSLHTKNHSNFLFLTVSKSSFKLKTKVVFFYVSMYTYLMPLHSENYIFSLMLK